MTEVKTPIIANGINPALTAAKNTYHFAKKPANGGMPAIENINTIKPKAQYGCVNERPAKSDNF